VPPPLEKYDCRREVAAEKDESQGDRLREDVLEGDDEPEDELEPMGGPLQDRERERFLAAEFCKVCLRCCIAAHYPWFWFCKRLLAKGHTPVIVIHIHD
jgi:hypothetical protein